MSGAQAFEQPQDIQKVFIFAGAGASFGMPAALPMFNPIRNELLRQIGLAQHVPTWTKDQTAEQTVVAGLAPEPFLLALETAGAAVEAWLTSTLNVGTPNAVHVALGQILTRGARVWTVNFDKLIETSTTPPLPALAWPKDPDGIGLCKPHGSLGGRLIFSAVDVLEPLGPRWQDRLEADLSDATHMIFIGYSARDLDMQPLWTRLSANRHVLWFDRQLPAAELTRRRAVVRDAASVTFLPAPTATAGIAASPEVPARVKNPSVAFVRWCVASGFATVPAQLVSKLDDKPVLRPYPVLHADVDLARAAVLSILGDLDGARLIHLRRLRTGPNRRAAASAILALTLNHGAPGLSLALRAAAVLPPLGQLGRVANIARRKRLTMLSISGRHDKVLRATANLADTDVSTLLLLRAASIRMTGSLKEAVDLATEALQRAKTERHNVRIAHASMQLCFALMWAGRLDEARRCLDDELRPFASLAAARWVAWADVLDAALLLHAGQPDRAIELLHLAESRFLAEGLVDGSVSALTVSLTVHRQAGNLDGFHDVHARLEKLRSARGSGRYYARGHVFSREAIDLEVAEVLADHHGDPAGAVSLLERVAGSRYAVHAGLAELYLARHTTSDVRSAHLDRTRAHADLIGSASLATAAARIAAGDIRPWFFP